MKEEKKISEERKINMEKVKQVSLVVIAVILLGIGFVNYNPDDASNKMAIVRNEDTIGDVQLVSSNAIVENENIGASRIS